MAARMMPTITENTMIGIVMFWTCAITEPGPDDRSGFGALIQNVISDFMTFARSVEIELINVLEVAPGISSTLHPKGVDAAAQPQVIPLPAKQRTRRGYR